MKLIYGSLGVMLAELRERKVEAVRVSPLTQSEAGRATGIPHYASRVVVTAPLDGQTWAECRLWVGRGMGEVSERGFRLPEALRERGQKLLEEAKGQIEAAGFRVLEGMLAHDADVVDGVLD